MANDDKLTEAIQLIKAGKKDAARSVLESLLRNNPKHLQAWMWEAELFPNDSDKIRILEHCLRHNPGNPQVIQAMAFLKKRRDANKRPAAPVPTSTPYSAPPVVKPTPSSSPVSTPFYLPDPIIPAGSIKLEGDVQSVPASEPRQPAMESTVVEEPRRTQPSDPKIAKPQKKSKWMSRGMMNVFMALMAFIGLIALIGLYVGGGINLNEQINASFAEQNCAGVVQNTTFVSIYPKAIFESMFTGYNQYSECQIKLDVERSLAANNWGAAITRTQEYLENYPNGTFAISMSEEVPNILSTWSEELIASHDYVNGIEKLKQLVETYPDSPPAQPAPDTILQSYLLWHKELVGNQNYAEAEQRLNTALSYFQTDPARSDRIKQELTNLYVDWGDMQVQLGDVDNGIKHYEMAGEISPGKVDIELLIARAGLQEAIDIAETGNFDTALVKVKEISDAAQAENVKSEVNAAQENILAAYSLSNSQPALDQMTAAINLTCERKRPELQIFGRDAEKNRFGLINFYVKLPTDWAAEKPGELRYVICINETDEELETCRYNGGHSLIRMRYVLNVTLYDILTGGEQNSKTFKGSSPDKCPPIANFQVGSAVSRSFGQRPTMDEIVAWLDKLNLRK